MLFYLSSSDDPFYNLALEEYLLKHSTEDILLCYINRPSLVIGRFQVPFREVDVRMLHEQQVSVARRLSGGGTVYHDLGNLNYSYISNCLDQTDSCYDIFNKKTIGVLEEIGLEGLSFQRNNIFCKGKKISGVAQYKRAQRMVHHGTLLVNANLAQLRALFTKKDYYVTKGIASVSSSVSNIDSFVTTSIDEVVEGFANSCSDLLSIVLDDKKILAMAATYSTLEWVLGKSPKYSIQNKGVELSVQSGQIVAMKPSCYSELVGRWHSYADLLAYVECPEFFF